MVIAYFSPLNPAPSGISDYSEELLPYLARYAEIELVVDGYTPTNPALNDFPRFTRNEFYARAAKYDVILYHMGNSPAHAGVYETLLRYPGVVVLHDVVLHHLRAWLTLERGNRTEYLAAMRAEYGEPGERAARGEINGRAPADRFEFPLNENVVRAARALIVHSEYAARQIQPRVPGTPVAVIPMGIRLRQVISREAARAALGFAPDEFLIAMFGDVQPNKRVLPALNAFADFHARYPESRLLLIGRPSPLFDVRGAAEMLGAADAVSVTGYVRREDYDLYTAAADLCLNLRYPTAGETSASLLRLFAAEKACIVTDTGAFADLPDEVCIKLRADAQEEKNLRAAFTFFAESPARGAAVGKAARAYVEQGHTLERAASAYADFLNEVAAARAVSRSYLRELTAQDLTGLALESTPVVINAKPVRSQMTPEDLTGSKPTKAVRSASGDWRDEVAEACAFLGIQDERELREIARGIVELGLRETD